MDDPLYREEILDHYYSSPHRGRLESPDRVSDLDNPLCGDEVHLELSLGSDGRIEQVRFDGHGCVISQAATSLARRPRRRCDAGGGPQHLPRRRGQAPGRPPLPHPLEMRPARLEGTSEGSGGATTMSQVQHSLTDILSQLLEPVGRMMPVKFAEDLAAMRAAPEVRERIDELAEKCTEGRLTPEERAPREPTKHEAADIESLRLLPPSAICSAFRHLFTSTMSSQYSMAAQTTRRSSASASSGAMPRKEPTCRTEIPRRDGSKYASTAVSKSGTGTSRFAVRPSWEAPLSVLSDSGQPQRAQRTQRMSKRQDTRRLEVSWTSW